MSGSEKPRVFPASDEVPHDIGEHPFWQESVFFTWGDHERGVYGYHRIGQEPNANDGKGYVTSWNGIATREGSRYCRYLLAPMRAQDRHAKGFLATDAFKMDYEDGKTRWRIEDADCSLDLHATDFTPRFDLYKDGGTVVNDYAQGHIEVAGPVRGTVRLGKEHFDIDGLVYRDHSWGKRIRGTLLSHRWIAGTIGPELTFNATSWHGIDGSLLTYGIVCRNGEITYAREVDILVHMEIDAYTHRGGMLRMVLEDGDVIELHPKIVDGFLTEHHQSAVIDAMCEVTWNGRKGFCDLEITTNPRGGERPVSALVRATKTQGLSKRDWTL
ncbi:DUF7064 domain-containing protein [Terricaulis silvestris]|uniref:Secreted hydrolase n=1 Tax=Terricaulis silvestris TaxID=2686094 RepID=A0A6I6MGK3_9CAUL|nr:hypothetical protein [Terricaulis silvestris]QGZ93780.1 hypothetical protein DSM104635_00593 [Terricaulis silvestris]